MSEDFGAALTALSIYVYTGTRYTLIELDGTGAVTYEFSGTLTMQASDVWSIIIEGAYDDGTASGTTNTISFIIKQ